MANRGYTMKRLTRLEVGAILIFGAGFAYLIGGEWYARQPEAQGANDMTTGAIATGTQLKREGEAVAELWAIRGIGERASDTVDLTHHLSPVKHLEVLGMLRELQPIDILGHHLPEQTGAWIDDLNSGAHISYQVAFPDGRIIPFTGWVQRVKVTGELAGAITFEATIRPVYAAPEYWHCLTDAPVGVPPSIGPDWEAILAPPGPSWWKCVVPVTSEHLMETPPPVEVLHHHWEAFIFPEGEYYHCTGAPAAPGTRPDEDPEHWEPVDPPDGIEEGEGVFGNAGTPDGWIPLDEPSQQVGALFPATGGAAQDGGIWPLLKGWADWTDPLGSKLSAYDDNPCAWMVYANDQLTRCSAHIVVTPEDIAYNEMMVVVYAADGTPLGASESVVVEAGEDWREFIFSTPIDLDPEQSYYIMFRVRYGPAASGCVLSTSQDYTPPNGAPWDDEEEYEYCQTVYLPPEDIDGTYWDPWGIYGLDDVVCYLPVYPEWEDDVQYKWCNWVHYKRPQ